MAFFDDLSKKITQVSQNAMGKTKDTADIFKLKNEISEEERKVVALYNEIGRLYASLHYEDFEPAFANLMTSLKESVAAIELRQAQIQNIRNVTTCSNCGAEIARESMFCSACGAQKEARVEIAPASLRCTGCGKPLENGSKFCTYCGTPVPVAESMPATPFAPVAPVDPFANANPVAPAEPYMPAAPVAPVNPFGAQPTVAPVPPMAPVAPVAPTMVGSEVFTPATPYSPVAPVSPIPAMSNEAPAGSSTLENTCVKFD